MGEEQQKGWRIPGFHQFVTHVATCHCCTIPHPSSSWGEQVGQDDVSSSGTQFFFLIFFFNLALLGLCSFAEAFSSCAEQGLLFAGAQVLGAWASVVAAWGLG